MNGWRGVLAIVGLAVVFTPALVAGREGTALRMVNPRFLDLPPIPSLTGPVGTAFVPGVSTGVVQRTNNCRQLVLLKDLAEVRRSDGIPGTGDEVICLAHMWIDFGAPAFGTLVMRGETVGRRRVRVAIEASIDTETGICERLGQFNRSEDVYYETRGTTCYEPDPSYAPALTVPFGSDPTQGLVLGAYAPRPASPVISTEGLSFDVQSHSPGGAFLEIDPGTF